MRICTTVTVTLLSGILMIAGSMADVPQVINYQGRLTNLDGTPVADGIYQMSFTIYDQDVGGATLWSCLPQPVSVDNGLFTYSLGLTSDLPDDLFATDTLRWLGINVGGEEITPRTKLTSVAYAYHSLRADTAATTDLPLHLEMWGDFNPTLRVTNNGDGGAIYATSSPGGYAGRFFGEVRIEDDLTVAGEIIGGSGVANKVRGVDYPDAFFYLDEGNIDYVVDSIDINIPAAGYVEITAGCYANLMHDGTSKSRVFVNISKVSSLGDWTEAGAVALSIPTGAVADTWQLPCITTRLYSESAGSHRYYLNVDYDSGTSSSTNLAKVYMRAKFYSTAYGIIDLSSPPAPGQNTSEQSNSDGRE